MKAKLIDARTGKMKCPECGNEWFANLKGGGKYHYGAWQCQKCKEDKIREKYR